MAENKKYVPHLLVVKIPENNTGKNLCSIHCPFHGTQAIRPYSFCHHYGQLEYACAYDAYRHKDCLSCPTLDVGAPAVKNRKQIEQTILVCADGLEDLGATSVANTLKELLKLIAYEEKD